MRVELLSVPNCPNRDRVRDLLQSCMAEVGIPVDMEESQGDYPSPSILVNGADVMGDPGYRAAYYRLDVPTREAVLRALRAR
jgi:hypothetical protein